MKKIYPELLLITNRSPLTSYLKVYTGPFSPSPSSHPWVLPGPGGPGGAAARLASASASVVVSVVSTVPTHRPGMNG
jgi:hypothetical protein